MRTLNVLFLYVYSVNIIIKVYFYPSAIALERSLSKNRLIMGPSVKL